MHLYPRLNNTQPVIYSGYNKIINGGKTAVSKPLSFISEDFYAVTG